MKLTFSHWQQVPSHFEHCQQVNSNFNHWQQVVTIRKISIFTLTTKTSGLSRFSLTTSCDFSLFSPASDFSHQQQENFLTDNNIFISVNVNTEHRPANQSPHFVVRATFDHYVINNDFPRRTRAGRAYSNSRAASSNGNFPKVGWRKIFGDKRTRARVGTTDTSH